LVFLFFFLDSNRKNTTPRSCFQTTQFSPSPKKPNSSFFFPQKVMQTDLLSKRRYAV
jgi:hypothetical protein